MFSALVNIEDILKEWRGDKDLSTLLDPTDDVYYEDFRNISEATIFRGSYKGEELVPINEETHKQILSKSDSKRKQRAKTLKTFYQGVDEKRGFIVFKTTSQYTPNKYYTQYIKLNEAKSAKYFKEFASRDVFRLMLLSGDISVYCSCPDFKYRFSYMGWKYGYGIFKEIRPPKIRNPKLEGRVCKHTIAVLSVLGMNWTKIAKDMTRTKYWMKRIQKPAVKNARKEKKQ